MAQTMPDDIVWALLHVKLAQYSLFTSVEH